MLIEGFNLQILKGGLHVFQVAVEVIRLRFGDRRRRTLRMFQRVFLLAEPAVACGLHQFHRTFHRLLTEDHFQVFGLLCCPEFVLFKRGVNVSEDFLNRQHVAFLIPRGDPQLFQRRRCLAGRCLQPAEHRAGTGARHTALDAVICQHAQHRGGVFNTGTRRLRNRCHVFHGFAQLNQVGVGAGKPFGHDV
ncbi:hypothetical protein SRABI106_04210 [Rahnella aquatilis]|nr:hypothetical protein SRABI106_04210 [Rahnella aquatilis]